MAHLTQEEVKWWNESPVVIYYVNFFVKEIIVDESVIGNVRRMLYHYQKKYPHVKWLMVSSNTDGMKAERTIERTGKRGRPKRIEKGSKVRPHIHFCFIGEDGKSAYSFAMDIYKYLNRKYIEVLGYKVAREGHTRSFDFIEYCLQQANRVYTGCDFDWQKYRTECFQQRKHEAKVSCI